MGRRPENKNRYSDLLAALQELHKLENHSRSFDRYSTNARKAAQRRDEQLEKVSKLAGDVLMGAKSIGDFTDNELQDELNRRKAERKHRNDSEDAYAKLTNLMGEPVGMWSVSTEGDCEGRTVRQLGTFLGHVADIAARLSSEACYSLVFKRVSSQPQYELKESGRVNIMLDAESGTQHLSQAQRSSVVGKWLQSKTTDEVDFFTRPPDAYGYDATELVFKRMK